MAEYGPWSMGIWSMVSSTPAEYVKDQVINGTQLKGVNPHYLVMQATESFGPMGIGWGLRDLKWQIIDRTLVMEAELWYEYDGVGSFPVIVDVPFQPGGDCFKKAQTMLQSKGLSKLGFAADVYMGLWEDEGFVEERQREAASRVKLKAAVKAARSAKSLEEVERMVGLVNLRVESGAMTSADGAEVLKELAKVKGKLDGSAQNDPAHDEGGASVGDDDPSRVRPASPKQRRSRKVASPDPSGDADGPRSAE